MSEHVVICAACFQSAHTWRPDETGCQCGCHASPSDLATGGVITGADAALIGEYYGHNGAGDPAAVIPTVRDTPVPGTDDNEEED